MKPVAESSKAADTERFERDVGVWKPTAESSNREVFFHAHWRIIGVKEVSQRMAKTIQMTKITPRQK